MAVNKILVLAVAFACVGAAFAQGTCAQPSDCTLSDQYCDTSNSTCANCTIAIAQCATCSFDSGTNAPECTSCYGNFTVNSTTFQCDPFPPCNATCNVTQACDVGTNTCLQCTSADPNCVHCSFNETTSAAQCSVCNVNYTLNASTYQCDYTPNCNNLCNVTQACNTTNNQCLNCISADPNCVHCSFNWSTNAGQCTVCNVNYTLNASTYQCDYTPNCSNSCNVTQACNTTNNQCLDCTSADPNCVHCSFNWSTNAGQCAVCDVNYTLNASTYQCDYTPNCNNQCNVTQACNTTNNQCLNCVSADPNCVHCSFNWSTNAGQCAVCDLNYTLNASTFKCDYNPQPCAGLCNVTQACDINNQTCLQCVSADPNCVHCSFNTTTDAAQCTVCDIGYTLNTTTFLCDLEPNCGGLCNVTQACDTVNNVCVDCTTANAECVHCNFNSTTNVTQCTVCNPGYNVSQTDNTCNYACNTTCEDNGAACDATSGKCVDCTIANQFCDACEANAGKAYCTTCSNGYNSVNGSCFCGTNQFCGTQQSGYLDAYCNNNVCTSCGAEVNNCGLCSFDGTDVTCLACVGGLSFVDDSCVCGVGASAAACGSAQYCNGTACKDCSSINSDCVACIGQWNVPTPTPSVQSSRVLAAVGDDQVPTAQGVCLQCSNDKQAAGTEGCTNGAAQLFASVAMVCALLVLALF